jgi:2-haloacid dehalogenase
LHDAGLRLAALTNSAPAAAETQLSNAGLKEFFEQIISVDAVKRYKPAPEPYRWAAERLGVHIGDMRLVAAHDWDVAGAMTAGCKAAFVARPGMVLNPLMPRPDVIGKDLTEVTQRLLE